MKILEVVQDTNLDFASCAETATRKRNTNIEIEPLVFVVLSREMGDNAVVGNAVRGFSAVFGLQLASKIFTFGLNAALARSVDRSTFGTAVIQMDLLMQTILTLSREGMRTACLRSKVGVESGNQGKSVEQLIRISRWCIPWSLVVATVVGLISTQFTSSISQDVALTSLLYCLGCGLEILSEPLFIITQNKMEFSTRAKIEGAAMIIRCVAIFLVIKFSHLRLVAFGIGQFIFGAFTSISYLIHHTRNQNTSLKILTQSLFSPNKSEDWGLVSLAGTFTFQAVQKLVLSHGESVVLLSIFSQEQWGVFGLVSNLASLVARLIFLPLEDMSRVAFSKLSHSDRSASLGLLGSILKILIFIGFSLSLFGPPFSLSLVHLVYGNEWSASEAPSLLKYYSVYLSFMALNGVTEAFVSSTADARQLKNLNIFMIFASAIYVILAVALAPYFGLRGLVLANCAGMTVRIGYSLRFIFGYFSDKISAGKLLRTCFPPAPVVGFFIFSFGVCSLSEEYFGISAEIKIAKLIPHILVGAIFFAGTLAAVAIFDKKFVSNLRNLKNGNLKN